MTLRFILYAGFAALVAVASYGYISADKSQVTLPGEIKIIKTSAQSNAFMLRTPLGENIVKPHVVEIFWDSRFILGTQVDYKKNITQFFAYDSRQQNTAFFEKDKYKTLLEFSKKLRFEIDETRHWKADNKREWYQ